MNAGETINSIETESVSKIENDEYGMKMLDDSHAHIDFLPTLKSGRFRISRYRLPAHALAAGLQG